MRSGQSHHPRFRHRNSSPHSRDGETRARDRPARPWLSPRREAVSNEDAERLRAERKAKRRAYYLANREQVLARNKAYRAANREKLKADQQAYYAANREKRRAYMAAHRAARRPARKQPR